MSLKRFYHGTDVPNKILQNGFKNADVSLWGPGVYLTGNTKATSRHGSSILEVGVDSTNIVDLGNFPKGDSKAINALYAKARELRALGKHVLVRNHHVYGDLVIAEASKLTNPKLLNTTTKAVDAGSTAMSLKEQFLKHIKTAQKLEDVVPTTINGVEISWSKKLNAWKVDMTTSIPEFLKNNPDIAETIKNKFPELDFNKLSIRDILKRGVAEEVLNQLSKATSNTTDSVAFIGQRILKEGSMSSAAKNRLYEGFAATQRALGSRRWVDAPGGGVILKPAAKGSKVGSLVFGKTPTGKVARLVGISPFLGGAAKAADLYVADQSRRAFEKDPNWNTGIQYAIDTAGVGDPTPAAAVLGLAWSYKDNIARAIGHKFTDNKGLSSLWYKEPDINNDHTHQPTKTD